MSIDICKLISQIEINSQNTKKNSSQKFLKLVLTNKKGFFCLCNLLLQIIEEFVIQVLSEFVITDSKIRFNEF